MNNPFSLVIFFSGSLFLGSFNSCKKKKSTIKTVGFYHWKSSFDFDSTEFIALRQLNTKRLYIKLFDIDTVTRNGRITLVPISITSFATKVPDSVEVIPVVYFTRQAILHVDSVKDLSAKLSTLIRSVLGNQGITFQEIQWDFDWTPKTKDSYFMLLKKLRMEPAFSDKIFSATIRLHQIRHVAQSGLPPVDRGLLMCYNMGNLKQPTSRNSILDMEVMKEYLKNVKQYPLPLDVALPLFEWALHFRNNEFKSIVRNVDTSFLSNVPHTHKNFTTTYKFNKPSLHFNIEFQIGDELKIEHISKELLLEASKYLSTQLSLDTFCISFFDLQSKHLKNISTNDLKEIISSF